MTRRSRLQRARRVVAGGLVGGAVVLLDRRRRRREPPGEHGHGAGASDPLAAFAEAPCYRDGAKSG